MLGHGLSNLSTATFAGGARAVDAEGHYELGKIPAGEYTLPCCGFVRAATIPVTLNRFGWQTGRRRFSTSRSDGIPASELSKQVVSASIFTPQGIPLPGCESA